MTLEQERSEIAHLAAILAAPLMTETSNDQRIAEWSVASALAILEATDRYLAHKTKPLTPRGMNHEH